MQQKWTSLDATKSTARLPAACDTRAAQGTHDEATTEQQQHFGKSSSSHNNTHHHRLRQSETRQHIQRLRLHRYRVQQHFPDLLVRSVRVYAPPVEARVPPALVDVYPAVRAAESLLAVAPEGVPEGDAVPVVTGVPGAAVDLGAVDTCGGKAGLG